MVEMPIELIFDDSAKVELIWSIGLQLVQHARWQYMKEVVKYPSRPFKVLLTEL